MNQKVQADRFDSAAVILAVDDREENLFILERIFAGYLPAYELITTPDAPASAALAERHLPDGILLDVQMPGVSGIELCRRIKCNPKTAHIPVVLITANETTSEVKARGLAAGAMDFICKPIDNLELAAKMNVMVQIKRSEDVLRRERESYRDVAGRRGEQLQQSERKYADLFNSISDGVVMHDRAGRILEVNDEACDKLGYTRQELLGMSMGQNESGVAPPRAGEIEAAGRLVYESEYKTRAGERIAVEVNSRAVEHEGQPAILSIVRDITERKRTEEALRRSEEQLRQAQKLESIGRLAGGVAHDFNNLLTTIIGYSELISTEQGLNDATKEGIQEIRNSAGRAAALTRQLLAFSRKQVLRPQVIELNHLITNLGKMLRRLIGEDIDLTTELDPNLGHIKADPGQVEQVIMNLVVNARDAMPEGGRIIIETQGVYLDERYHQQHSQVTPGDYVFLAVSDTGHGMDEETKEHIFEPFYTTKGVGEGTGLGLSTVYGIVKQSGGFIWVYSEPEMGTTFKVYLPLLTATKKQQEDLPEKRDPMGGTETIFLVEDEEPLRKIAGKILEGYGYCVIEATDGMDALEIVNKKENHPEIDLLVTDVVMPKMGGKQLSEKLVKEYAKLKVLYICGYTDKAIALHGVLDKGVSLLQKPFSPQSLAEKVREVLDDE